MMKQFLKNNFWYTLSSILLGILNWGFNVLVLKLTDQNVVSSYFSFSGLLIIFALPTTWISLMTVKVGRSFGGIISKQIKNTPITYAVLSLMTLLILYFVFKLANLTPELFLLLPLITGIALLSAYYKGIIQGGIKFEILSFIGLVEVVVKIITFLILFNIGITTIAVFVALITQFILGLLLSRYFAKDIQVDKYNLPSVNTSLIAFAYAISFIFITNIDVVFARINLNQANNFEYVAMLQIAKILIFICMAFIGVLIPTLEKYKNEIKLLIKFSIVSLIGNFLFALTLMFFVTLFFDAISSYLEFNNPNLGLLLLFLLGTASLCMAQVPFTILFIKNRIEVVVISALAAIMQIGLYIVFAHSLLAFIFVYAIEGIFIALSSTFVIIYNFKIKNKNKIWITS